MNCLELKDKVAVVTGATAFIGRACAIRLAEQGAAVVVSGRNAEAGAAVVAEIEAAGGRACFEAADLFDAGQMQVGSLIAFLAYFMQILMAVLMATLLLVLSVVVISSSSR